MNSSSFATPGPPPDQRHAEAAALAGRLDELLAARLPWSEPCPSVTVLVDQGGTTIYSRSTGLADIENRVRADENTVYALGSLTKSYTALAILQLAEKGAIDLEAPVSSYLQGYAGPGSGVLIRQLLDHTAGLVDYTDIAEFRSVSTWRKLTREEVLGYFAARTLEFEPGSRFQYSNSGYYLLGLIVEAAAELDYYTYLERHVFAPLSLNASFSGRYEQLVPRRARGYVTTAVGFENAAPTPNLTPFAAGSLLGSARDLVRFRRAVFKGESVSPKLRRLVTSIATTFPDGTRHLYTLGALISGAFHGRRRLWHSGGISGFASNLDYFPEEDLTVAILINAENAPVSPASLGTKVAREVFGIPQPVVRDEELRGSELSPCLGEYEMAPFLVPSRHLGIVEREGSLHLRVGAADREDAPLVPLRAQGKDEFVFATDDEMRIRLCRLGGEVVGLEVHQAGLSFPGSRSCDRSDEAICRIG